MSKNTFYYSSPRRILSKLLRDLASREVEHTSSQLEHILKKKKNKMKELYASSSHQVMQPPMRPLRIRHSEFTTVRPMATEQEFISEKAKANALTPERFYTRQPNIKAGSYESAKKWSLCQDRRVTNAKFEQYNRVVDDQSGIVKKQRIAKILSNYSVAQHQKERKFSRMKKTYFQKFMPDKYNFYKPVTQNTIGLQSTSILRKSRSRGSRVFDSSDIRLIQVKKDSLPLMEKDHKTLDLPAVKSHRSRDKSRDPSPERTRVLVNRGRLKTVVMQKNMDSLN